MFLGRAPVALALVLLLASALLAADLPRKSPDFTIQIPGAKPLALKQYRGKSVVFLFILTTCPHCQKAIGCLSKDARDFAARGLQVLAAAVENDAAEHLPAFIHSLNPSFPVGYTADYDAVYDFMHHPRNTVPKMPLISFIDKSGMIRAQYEGNDALLDMNTMEGNLRKAIEDLLKR